MNTEETVIGILAKIAEVDVSEIKLEMELVAGLGIDSPKALQLLFELEEALKIEISDEQAAQMETVADILKLVTNEKIA